MADGWGAKVKFGLAKAATWGVAATVGALDGIYITGISPLVKQREVIPDESLGYTFLERMDQGLENVDVVVDLVSRYENKHWQWIAMFMGDDSVSTASPYTHTMALQEESSIYFTGAGIIDDIMLEYPSIKATGFTLSGSSDSSQYTLQLRGIADTVEVDSDCTNSSTNTDNLTYSTQTNLMKFTHTRVYMNAQAGAILGTAAAIYPNSISIEANNNFVREFLADRTTANSKEDKTSEPQRDGYPEMMVTLGFPELTLASQLQEFENASNQKMEIYIYEDANQSVKFEFPNLQPLQPDISVSSPGRIPRTMVYQALRVASTASATGMAFVEPMRVTLINTCSGAFDV